MDKVFIDSVFFDFDGTLGDTSGGIFAAWRKTIAEMGIPSPTFETEFRVGPPVHQQAKIVYPDADEETQTRAGELYKYNYDNSDMIGEAPYPWSEDILKYFQSRGKKIYVVTYKRLKSTAKLIERYGFEKYLSGVFTTDICPGTVLTKSEMLRLAIRVANCAPDNALMVGDTELDIAAGHELQCHTCAVSWGYAPLEKLISSQPELLTDKDNFIEKFSERFF